MNIGKEIRVHEIVPQQMPYEGEEISTNPQESPREEEAPSKEKDSPTREREVVEV